MTKTNLFKKQKIFIFDLKRNFTGILFSAIILLMMLLIISNPALFSNSTIKGLNLFIFSVLPGLFPFMFLTKLLTEIGIVFKATKRFSNVSRKLFGTSGVSLYCFFMSILSGYPIGAKIISDLYSKNLIDTEDAKRMSIFCTTSGPIFVIGAVGVSMLKSFKLGLIIYISHILSSLLCGILYKLISKNKSLYNTKLIFATNNQNENTFANCLTETITSLFMVGGYITIFYLLSEMLEVLNIFSILTSTISPLTKMVGISNLETKSILYGIVEVTRGCKDLSVLKGVTAPAICGLISFSGISIIMQSLAFLKTAKIKAHTFIFSKCVQSIISILICQLFIILC